jgi:hypothetical protein
MQEGSASPRRSPLSIPCMHPKIMVVLDTFSCMRLEITTVLDSKMDILKVIADHHVPILKLLSTAFSHSMFSV